MAVKYSSPGGQPIGAWGAGIQFIWPGTPARVITGLLIFCDVAISHNRPQIATFRIIHQTSHNSGKIARFEERTRKYLLLTKVLRQFKRCFKVIYLSQKTLEITKIVRERSVNQIGVLCVVLHVGELVLVLNRREGIYFMVESHKCTGNIHSVYYVVLCLLPNS